MGNDDRTPRANTGTNRGSSGGGPRGGSSSGARGGSGGGSRGGSSSGARGGSGGGSRGDARGDARGDSGDAPFSRARGGTGKNTGGSSAGRGASSSGGSAGGRGEFPDRRGNQTSSRPDPRNRDPRDPRDARDPRDQATRTAEQARYDGPPIEETITGTELDHNIAQQLRGLPEKLANRVARHLVAAGLLLEDDPETAYQHTLAARARAARIAVVREACGEAAYAAGHYPEALTELRAAKRINGSQDYLPVMADCERALGRPDRALTLARNPAVANLDPALKAEMTIVEAGARRDLGELDAALRTLENAPLRSKTRADWVVRLRYTYADTLQAANRPHDALEWFHRTTAIDTNHTTDAEHRATQLEHTTTT